MPSKSRKARQAAPEAPSHPRQPVRQAGPDEPAPSRAAPSTALPAERLKAVAQALRAHEHTLTFTWRIGRPVDEPAEPLESPDSATHTWTGTCTQDTSRGPVQIRYAPQPCFLRGGVLDWPPEPYVDRETGVRWTVEVLEARHHRKRPEVIEFTGLSPPSVAAPAPDDSRAIPGPPPPPSTAAPMPTPPELAPLPQTQLAPPMWMVAPMPAPLEPAPLPQPQLAPPPLPAWTGGQLAPAPNQSLLIDAVTVQEGLAGSTTPATQVVQGLRVPLYIADGHRVLYPHLWLGQAKAWRIAAGTLEHHLSVRFVSADVQRRVAQDIELMELVLERRAVYEHKDQLHLMFERTLEVAATLMALSPMAGQACAAKFRESFEAQWLAGRLDLGAAWEAAFKQARPAQSTAAPTAPAPVSAAPPPAITMADVERLLERRMATQHPRPAQNNNPPNSRQRRRR